MSNINYEDQSPNLINLSAHIQFSQLHSKNKCIDLILSPGISFERKKKGGIAREFVWYSVKNVVFQDMCSSRRFMWVSNLRNLNIRTISLQESPKFCTTRQVILAEKKIVPTVKKKLVMNEKTSLVDEMVNFRHDRTP